MLYAIVGMLVIILDQAVKFWITNNFMVGSATEPLIPGVLSLVRIHNDGAAFSFLAGGGARIYFIILTAVFTVAVIVALVTNFINGRFGRWCLVLVTAGGLSNCLDRILYGYVVDMFKIDLFNFAVFNVADIFITVFAILFIIYIIFGKEEKLSREPDEFDEEDDEDDDRVSMRDAVAEVKPAMRPKAEAKRERRETARGSKYAPAEEDEAVSPRFTARRQTRSEAKEAVETARARAPRELDGFGKAAPSGTNRTPRAEAKRTKPAADFSAAQSAQPKPRTASAPAYDPDNPFAEWERANERVESREANSSMARAMGIGQTARTAERPVEPPAESAAERPVVREQTERPVEKPAETKAAADFVGLSPELQPKPKTPAAPKPGKVTADDFSLDDILNEFK